jgi:hypothetical protein
MCQCQSHGSCHSCHRSMDIRAILYRGLRFQCTRADNGSPALPASRWPALIIGNADINRSPTMALPY